MKRIITTMVLLLCAACFLNAQSSTVTGNVYEIFNGQKDGLIGVGVQEKGTNNFVLTDANGDYSITPRDADAELVFSCLGYETKTIPINGRIRIDVQMVLDSQHSGIIGRSFPDNSREVKE